MSKLAALRQQPKSVKNQYAFGGAVVITSVIALLWAVALPDVLSSKAPEVSADAADQTGLTAEFFAEVGEGVANIFASFSASGTESETITVEQDTASTTPTPTAPTFAAPAPEAGTTSNVLRTETLAEVAPKRILIATTSVDSLESE